MSTKKLGKGIVSLGNNKSKVEDVGKIGSQRNKIKQMQK
jgi:hypothetical protein